MSWSTTPSRVVPILASYCPLCGSAIAFVREIDAGEGMEAVEFGVSGKLYNSDLLMYDRKTDSYWSQLTGTAVVGEMTGTRLEIYPSELLTWGEWKQAYPDSDVLTRSSGHNRDYDQLPYAGYDESSSIWFPVTATDDRLHEKTRITGVELSFTNFGAYPDDLVAENGPVNDDLRGEPLLIAANPHAGDNVVVFRRDIDGQVLTFSAGGSGPDRCRDWHRVELRWPGCAAVILKGRSSKPSQRSKGSGLPGSHFTSRRRSGCRRKLGFCRATSHVSKSTGYLVVAGGRSRRFGPGCLLLGRRR